MNKKSKNKLIVIINRINVVIMVLVAMISFLRGVVELAQVFYELTSKDPQNEDC